jgi:CPA1 family monovalent cation:H+ antiporter
VPAIGPAIAWIVILLLISTYIAAWIGHLRVPYTVGLVLAGIVLGAVGVLPATTFNPDLVLLVLLPPLLFEAAYALEWDRLRRVVVAMVSLATVGVILSAAVTAAIAIVALQLSVGDAAILGVLVAATDPVAVIAFFREAKVDRDLVTLVEGESLLNDGTVVVLVSVVVAWLGRGQISVPGAIGQFLLVSLGGIAVGGLVGFAGAVMTPRRDDFLLEATISLTVAYGSYLLALQLGMSGILATVGAGAVLGTVSSRRGLSPTTRELIDKLWEFLAFVANSFVFLLLGIAVSPAGLSKIIPSIVLGVAAALAGRIACVYLVGGAVNRATGQPCLRWQHILVVGGLRGALPVVIAISLGSSSPALLPVADLVLGIVVVSLVLQGLALEPMIRRLLPQEPPAPAALAI